MAPVCSQWKISFLGQQPALMPCYSMGIFHDEQNSVTLESSIFSAQSKIINSIRLAALPLAMAAA